VVEVEFEGSFYSREEDCRILDIFPVSPHSRTKSGGTVQIGEQAVARK